MSLWNSLLAQKKSLCAVQLCCGKQNASSSYASVCLYLGLRVSLFPSVPSNQIAQLILLSTAQLSAIAEELITRRKANKHVFFPRDRNGYSFIELLGLRLPLQADQEKLDRTENE